MGITIDVTAQGPLTGRGRHFMLEGRLDDRPAEEEPMQISNITHRGVEHDGKKLKVVLPGRTVSCIEPPRKR